MDLAIRQELQDALQKAKGPHPLVTIRCTDGRSLSVRSDFVCYETHIDATTQSGEPITLQYADIKSAEAGHPARH